MGLSDYLKHAARRVDKYIYSFVTGTPKELYEASLHLIRAGGKRVRPALALLSSRLVGGSEEDALPAAAALELIHVFTLIHDDIMDRDDYRRGVPTVHRVWGEPMAITAGDLLFAKAFESASRLLERGIEPGRVVEAMRVLAKAASTVAEGQALDMMFEERWDVTVDEYMDMIYRKTGALIEASAWVGGLSGGASPEEVEALGEYGWRVGVAFQIRDDILGIYGSGEKLGKPVYSDLREGKKTLLIIYAMQHLDDEGREFLKRVVGNPNASQEEYRRAAELIREAGALDHAMERAKKLVDEAKKSLSRVDARDEEAKEILVELADFIVRREY